MKVKISDLKPNPFRDIAHYPIDQSKVESLINSIKETGFWDNILARQTKNGIEITYGHHRLEALKKALGESAEVDIPIHDLSDDTMLRIMAEENNDLYAISISVVDETIRQVKKYLENGHPLKMMTIPSLSHSGQTAPFKAFSGLPIPKKADRRCSIIALQIADWLGKNWSAIRIYEAILRIQDEEGGNLDRQAIESLPSLTHGDQFRKVVKKHRLTKPQQRRVAKRIMEKNVSSVGPNIEIEAIAEVAGPEKAQEKKSKDLADLIVDCRKNSEALLNKLKTLAEYAEDFCGPIYSKTLEAISLKTNLRLVRFSIDKILGKEKKNETKKLKA